MSAKLRKDPINIDLYCDNNDQELNDEHPATIFNNKEKLDKLMDGLTEDLENKKQYHYARPLLSPRWWPDRHMNL
jgi:hypothetical protein